MDSSTYIKLTQKGIHSNNLSYPDAMQLLFSAVRQLSLQILEDNPNLRDDIYDWVNQASATILQAIDPAAEPNPGFDPDRIIEEENARILNEAEQLQKTNPRRYKKMIKAYRQIKSDLRARALDQELRSRQIDIDEHIARSEARLKEKARQEGLNVRFGSAMEEHL